jgi:hypothetical protein
MDIHQEFYLEMVFRSLALNLLLNLMEGSSRDQTPVQVWQDMTTNKIYKIN